MDKFKIKMPQLIHILYYIMGVIYRRLTNIRNLYNKAFSKYKTKSYDHHLGNLYKYLKKYGLIHTKSDKAEQFINDLIKEIPTLSNNEKRDLLNISNTTLQQLQTGDIILFRNMPYINNVIWPTAASIVITKNIILKKPKKKSIKKKKLLNK